jgi:hypothetical protein
MELILLNNNLSESFLNLLEEKCGLVENVNTCFIFYSFSIYHCITQARWLNSLIRNEFDYDKAELFFRDTYDSDIDSLELRLCFDDVSFEVWSLIYELHTDTFLDLVNINATVKRLLSEL